MKLLKKAQVGGVEISIFILLMILFIIIYVILLPPAEREELLAPFEETEIPGIGIPTAGDTLLSEQPGKVFPYTSDKQENSLAATHIYTKHETKTQALVKSLSVSRNVLKDNYKNVYFDLPGLEGIKSIKLLFLIAESKGSVTIKLNSHILFDGVMAANNLPLEMPLGKLKKSKNKLTLSVNSPMPNILSTNYYLIEDVNLIKEISTSAKKARRSFFVEPELNVKSSKLSYFINCNDFDTEGTLTISFNNNKILEDRVFCEYLSQRELDLNKGQFSEAGHNTLMFEIDQGDYNIDKIKVKTTLSRASYPSYTFDLDSETYDDIDDGDKHAKLYFAFPDATAKKRATVSVQGKEFFFETSGSSYSKEISKYLAEGTNYIRIIPKTEFEISEMRIIAE